MKGNQKFREVKKNKAGAVNIAAAITAIILLIVGFAIATLLTIFTSVLGGQTYQLTEGDIQNISNATIKGYVQAAVIGGFQAQSQVSSYLPIIALAVIITIVITLVIGGIASQFMGPSSYDMYGRGGGGYIL